MKGPATSKEAILQAAVTLAVTGGLEAVNVRAIAAECGVAVGTVYHYYPSKAALCNAVAEEFWRQAMHGAGCWQQTESFAGACAHLTDILAAHLAQFEDGFVQSLEKAGEVDRQAGKALETRYFAHMRAGLLAVLERDPRVNTALWEASFTQEDAVRFFLAAILGAARAGAPGGAFVGRAAAQMLYLKEEI